PGLVLVLTLSFFPIAYMNLLGMLRSLDPALDEAGSSLGANKWRVFRTVTLPLLIPGFAGSFLLLFIESIADLANPIIIGGNYTVLASLQSFIIASPDCLFDTKVLGTEEKCCFSYWKTKRPTNPCHFKISEEFLTHSNHFADIIDYFGVRHCNSGRICSNYRSQ
ncbi:MAG: hypothetical protein RL029_419, partial [Actinomycetota bacterium]